MIPPGHIDLMKKYYKTVSLSSYDLPKVLQDRGVNDPNKLPGFHYRDDALKLWDAIRDYVSRILAIYYHSDEEIKKVCYYKLAKQVAWLASCLALSVQNFHSDSR